MATTPKRSLTTEQLEIIEEQRAWLEEERQNYENGVAILNDPGKSREFMKSLMAKLQDALRYDATIHQPHVAVAIVSKIQERVSGLAEDLEFLDLYEERREAYLERARSIPEE